MIITYPHINMTLIRYPNTSKGGVCTRQMSKLLKIQEDENNDDVELV